MARDRRSVGGLTKADFTLSEDDRPQEIVAFEAVDARKPAEGVGIGAAVTSTRSVEGRTFAVVWDDLHMTPAQAIRARAALDAFLRAVEKGGQILLVATGDGVPTLARLPQGLDELSSRIAQLRGLVLPMQWGPPARVRKQLAVEALAGFLRSLEPIKGRKAVILMSSGLPYNSAVLSGTRCSDCDAAELQHRTLVQASLRSNAPIYSVDLRGLQDGRNLQAEATASAASDAVASDTGGMTLRNTNDFASLMWQIAEESTTYYLLGYHPTNQKRDGKFRRVRVEVNMKDVTVRARRGYFGPSHP